MTNDTSRISFFRQIWYWLRKKFDVYTMVYLGYNEHGKPIAFGVLYYDEQLQPWVTGGVLAAHRGHGYGRMLFTELCAEFFEPVWLEVFDDNISAKTLYKNLGFQEVSRHIKDSREVITMKRDYN